MGTLSGLLNTSRNALLSDQVAINTTAANISNENTAGYTKQVVNWTENDTVQIGSIAAGTGSTATVSSQRDRILDRSVQQATDTAAASSTRSTALQSLQSLFSIGSTGDDSSGIQAAIDGFFSGVSSLAADPTSSSARQTTLASAQTLANAFNRTSAAIATQTASLNGQVATGVAQVNGLLSQIAVLNGKIATSTAGIDTSSYQDQQTQLITQLSGLIGLQQTSANDGTTSLTTTNGTLLLDGTSTFPLTTSNVSGTTRVFASANSGGADITAALQGGSIGGNIQARDADLPAVTSQLDTLAYIFATAVNAQNEAGNGQDGAAGTAIFSIGTSVAGSASTIGVALTDGSHLAAAAATEGSGGSSNANALLTLQSSNTVGDQSFSSAFGSLLSGLGTTVSSATTDSTADAAIQTQLSTQRDSVEGVSLDEEAANLTQYQRSYQAAAKLLTILDTLLATVINLGTDAAVS